MDGSVLESHDDGVRWLQDVTLTGAAEPTRVVFDGRDGNIVFVRQADPRDGEPSRVPIGPGDTFVVMTAISHISHHLTADPEDASSFLLGMRVLPVRREGGCVYARSLCHDEVDSGDRVHLRPGEELRFEAGSIVAELAAIDCAEGEGVEGYVPLTPVLWTWFQFGSSLSAAKIRYLLAAARRLDAASLLFEEINELRIDRDLPAPQRRRNTFALIGAVEMAIIALGRSLDMIMRAEALLGIVAPPPPVIRTVMRSITAIRNAYEHIEDRALGQVREMPHPDALSIFDYTALVERKQVTYGAESLDLVTEVPGLMAAARDYLKQVAGESN